VRYKIYLTGKDPLDHLVTSRSDTSFKGYQHTFPEFLSSLRAGLDGYSAGPIHVDNSRPAVDQLWDEVQGVLEFTNLFMIPFLKLFGVEEGNGLSPFAVDISSPKDLLSLVETFFKPPKEETRGRSSEVDQDLPAEEPAPITVEESLPASIIANYMNELQTAEGSEDGGDLLHEDGFVDSVQDSTEVETNFFDAGDSSNAYAQFKALVRCENISNIPLCALKVVELEELGKMEKGAVSSAGHYNSRNARWFNKKKTMAATTNESGGDIESGDAIEPVFIKRHSLVQVNCKHGRSEAVTNYRVLALFSKYYNKWFVGRVENFPWTNDPLAVKNAQFLVRMVKKAGSSYSEEILEAGGTWSPKQIYCMKNYSDILDVDSELVDI